MVTSIGFRCWPDRFSYVVLQGAADDPTVVAQAQTRFPNDLTGPRLFAWLREEAQNALEKHRPEVGFIKIAERGRGSAVVGRLQAEAIIQEAAFSGSGLELHSRIKIQIKRDISFARPARYVDARVAEHDLAALNNDRFREACLAALCGLPES